MVSRVGQARFVDQVRYQHWQIIGPRPSVCWYCSTLRPSFAQFAQGNLVVEGLPCEKQREASGKAARCCLPPQTGKQTVTKLGDKSYWQFFHFAMESETVLVTGDLGK
jgi:hypothetical protein